MRIASFICLAVIASFNLPMVDAADLTKDSLAEVKQNVEDKKAVLVDVREKKEWSDGHVEGAISLPLSSIQNGVTNDQLKRLPKDKILYVHCVLGKRAVTAGNILEQHGYQVRPLKPGYKEMISAGFPKAEM